MQVLATLALMISVQGSASLPNFEFRGLTTGSTEAEALQRGVVESCRKYAIPGVRQCALRTRTLGGASTMFGSAQFRQGRLIYVGALVPQPEFNRVKEALDQRYGRPCLTNPSPSRMLKVGFSYYWCFSDGAAVLEQFSTGGMSGFKFYDRTYDDIIANLRPQVDF